MTQPAPVPAELHPSQVEKNEADTEAVRVGIEKTRAEIARLADEREKLQAEAREAHAKAVRAEIDLAREQRKEADELARDVHHHRYVFNGAVTESSVNNCIATLTAWSRQDPNCDIEIVFNSPGGSVVDGMALFDYIQMLRRSGHYVTTAALGMAASMAGILLQAGDRRVLGAQSWLMVHEASFGASGKTGEVEDRVEWVKRVQERILDIFADRCRTAAAETASKRLSRVQIRNRWHRKDWWISSDEALAYGLVDEVR